MNPRESKKIKKTVNQLEAVIEQLRAKNGEKEKLWQEIKDWWKKRNVAVINSLGNISLIKVISVIPLEKKEMKVIEDRLNHFLDQPFILKNVIDKNILGGVIIKIDGKIIDTSLHHKLNQIKPWIKKSIHI